MSWFDDLSYRLRALTGRRLQEQELDQELHFHLEMETDRRVAEGQDRAEAERLARIELGYPELVKEKCRDAWGTRLAQESWRDVRGALRHLTHSPRFALAAIGSLAIGIGSATVIFSVVDAVLLEPLPFGAPDRIVALHEITPKGDEFSTSDATMLDFAARGQHLSAVAAIGFPIPSPALEQDGVRTRLDGLTVTPDFFRVLGVQPQLGRAFSPEEGAPGTTPRVCLLADDTWRQRFAARPELVGSEIDLDGELWTVIGILPPRFRFGGMAAEIFLPYVPDPAYPRDDHRLTAFARLTPGSTWEQARLEIAEVARQLAREHPETNADWGATLTPIEQHLLGPTVQRTNLILLGAVLLLLLLACVNVSNLILARASDRAPEIRLRLALGASRSRVLAQLMVEAVVLGALGAGAALLLALWAVPVVRGLGAPMPRMDEMAVDWRVIAFAAVVAVLCGIVFGLVPALRASATPAAQSLRTRPHGSDRSGARLRAGLVALEVALATVLTVAAGLFFRSFVELQAVDAGLDPTDVLLVQVDLPETRYPESDRSAAELYDRLLQRIERLPGVEAAGANMVSPYRGPSPRNTVATVDETEHDAFLPVQWRAVTPDYFRAVRTPMLRGRSFVDGEARMEVVVSGQVAEHLWPGEEPLGKQLRWSDPEGPTFEVVGVVGEVRDLQLGTAPAPMVYVPESVVGWPTMTVAIRSNRAPDELASFVREILHDLDPVLATPDYSTLTEQRQEALAAPLLGLRLMSIFSIIALLLAAVGVYGMVAYSVSRRRQELGLRVALGARPRQVATLVARRSMAWIAAGLLAGVTAALALVGTTRALLYQTSPFDPRVLGVVAVLMIVVGLAASWLPAIRAARLDPVGSLREE